jgi:DNA-directed RNA polymerase subunit RPC12/RpoP
MDETRIFGISPKRAAIIGGALVLLIVSGTFFAMGFADEEEDPAQRVESLWYCPDCKHAMTRVGDVRVAYKRFTSTSQADRQPQPRKARDGIAVIECEKCSHWTARAAAKCAKCGEVFPRLSDEGKRLACPKCGSRPNAKEAPDQSDVKPPMTPAY